MAQVLALGKGGRRAKTVIKGQIASAPRRKLQHSSKRASRMFHADAIDGPTIETLWRAAERMGVRNPSISCDLETRQVHINFDPHRGGSALSLLYHKQAISSAMYKAGADYGYLRYVVYNRAWPRISSILESWVASEIWERIPRPKRRSEASQEEIEQAYADACRDFDAADNKLKRLVNRDVRRMVRLCCIDGIGPANDEELFLLISGLVRLAAHWRMVDQEAT